MATTTTASLASRRAPWWQRASWIGLILLGAFNVYAAVADLVATAGTGLPGDHAGTFAAVTGRTWASFKAAQPGAAHYVTLLERGYALHELTFAILFLLIVAIPLRAGQRWAWWACWTVLIAYLGYTFTLASTTAPSWPAASSVSSPCPSCCWPRCPPSRGAGRDDIRTGQDGKR
jgi:hypothetical protein